MGGVKLKNGLGGFLKRLKGYEKLDTSDIADAVGEIAKESAEMEYAQSGVAPTRIDVESKQNQVEIVAVGEHLAFSEFGTGIVGSGTYGGELPTRELQFESPKGIQQSTDGWQYNYRKEQGQTEKDWKGFTAKAQILKTANRLEQDLAKEVAKRLKKGE